MDILQSHHRDIPEQKNEKEEDQTGKNQKSDEDSLLGFSLQCSLISSELSVRRSEYLKHFSSELNTPNSELNYLKTVPTEMGCPKRKSRTVILFLPSNWTSLMRKKSFPVSTSMKSDPTHTTVPIFPVGVPSFISPL